LVIPADGSFVVALVTLVAVADRTIGIGHGVAATAVNVMVVVADAEFVLAKLACRLDATRQTNAGERLYTVWVELSPKR
jgi:hypothetical protein